MNAPAMTAPAPTELLKVLDLLAAEDARQSKVHELLETIREQIRLEVAPEHRPEGLFNNIQNAVYAMRGRTLLMNDAAITGPIRQAASVERADLCPTCKRADNINCSDSFHVDLSERAEVAGEAVGSLQAFAADLASKQQPLGDEFAKVLAEMPYESDTSPSRSEGGSKGEVQSGDDDKFANGILEAVTDELLAHGEFSSGANNRSNAREAARVVIDMVRSYGAAQAGHVD